jgi:hypothetical protein
MPSSEPSSEGPEPGALGRARLARRLAQRLSRLACPSAHALGEFELGLGTAEERLRIEAHIQHCPLCAGELRVLREFL